MSAKAPAFQWYAADYLADERVIQLSLESEACYVRLLNYCWREGTIPASAAQCAPLCKYADLKVIKPALALFNKSPTQPGRLIHKRLEEERAKQEAFRERQAQHGKKGGRPRREDAPDEKPKKPNPLPSLSQPLAEPNPSQSPHGPSSSSSTSSSTSSSEDESADEAPPPVLKSSAGGKSGAEQKAAENPHLNTFTADTWPGLTNPVTFASICAELRLPIDLDQETYRTTIQAKMRAAGVNALASTMASWIASFFVTEKKKGPLLTLTVGLPTKPTPRSEWPEPGKERPGQIIAIEGVPGDENLNRMKVASYQKHWPTATIHAIR